MKKKLQEQGIITAQKTLEAEKKEEALALEKKEHSKQKEELAKEREKLEGANTQIERLTRALEEANRDLLEAKYTQEYLDSERLESNKQKDILTKATGQLEQIKRSLEESNREAEEKKKYCDTLLTSKSVVEQKLKEQVEKTTELEQELGSVQWKNKTLEALLAQSKERCTKFEENLEATQSQIETARMEASVIQAQLASEVEKSQEQQVKIDHLRKKLVSNAVAEAKGEDAVQKIKEELAAASSELKAQKDQYSSLLLEQTRAQEDNNLLRKNNTIANKKISDLESEGASVQVRLSFLEKEITSLKDELGQATTQKNKFEAFTKELEEKLENANMKLRAAETNRDSFKKTIETLTKDLEAQLKASQEEALAKAKELERIAKERTANKSLEDKHDKLQEELKKSNDLSASLKSELKTIKEELDKTLKLLVDKEDSFRASQEELTQKTTKEKQELEKALEASLQKLAKQAKEADESKNQLATAQDKLTAVNTKLAEANEQLVKRSKEYEEMKDKLSITDDKLTDANEEIKKLNLELSVFKGEWAPNSSEESEESVTSESGSETASEESSEEDDAPVEEDEEEDDEGEARLIDIPRDGSINSYIVFQNVIGEGAYGEVHKGMEKHSGRTVAIKVIKTTSEKLNNSEEVENVHRELHIQSPLRHRNILGILSFYSAGTIFYLTMPLMGGGSIFDLISEREDGLSEEQAKKYARQILTGIEFLHEVAFVCHRDIKPENILLNDSHTICKICDFGEAAEYTEDNPYLTGYCGTPYYQALEIWNQDKYTNKVDLWAAGVLIYVMLTAGQPWDWYFEEKFEIDDAYVPTPQEVRDSINQTCDQNKVPSQLAEYGLSAQVTTLLSKLIEPDYEKRWSATDALLESPWLA